MSRWALIEGGSVANVVESDGQPTASGTWVDLTGITAGPGWAYANGAFTAPAQPRNITPVAFRNRFTAAEKARLELAATDVPTAATQDRLNAAALRASLRDVEAASYIDLDRADIRARVQALETASLLDAAGRALVILDTAVDPNERA